MAFKTVSKTGNFKYVKYTECQPNQVIAEGNYLGTKEGKFGIQHQFRDPSGKVVVLNSAGQLNNTLAEEAQLGDYVRVTFLGKDKIRKGDWKGQMANQFQVEIDTDQYADPSSLEVPTASASEETEETAAAEEGPSEEEVTAAKKATAEKAQAAKAKATTAAAPAKKNINDLVNKFRK